MLCAFEILGENVHRKDSDLFSVLDFEQNLLIDFL